MFARLEVAVERGLASGGDNLVKLDAVREADAAPFDRHNFSGHHFPKGLFAVSPFDLERDGFPEIEPFTGMKKKTGEAHIGDHHIDKRNF